MLMLLSLTILSYDETLISWKLECLPQMIRAVIPNMHILSVYDLLPEPKPNLPFIQNQVCQVLED